MLGAEALKIFFNLPSGNSCGKNIYDLLDLYFKNPGGDT